MNPLIINIIEKNMTAEKRSSPQWDLIIVSNIFNIRGDFIILNILTKELSIMSERHSAEFYKDGFLFKCNNAKKDIKRHNYVYDDVSCPVTLTK